MKNMLRLYHPDKANGDAKVFVRLNNLFAPVLRQTLQQEPSDADIDWWTQGEFMNCNSKKMTATLSTWLLPDAYMMNATERKNTLQTWLQVTQAECTVYHCIRAPQWISSWAFPGDWFYAWSIGPDKFHENAEKHVHMHGTTLYTVRSIMQQGLHVGPNGKMGRNGMRFGVFTFPMNLAHKCKFYAGYTPTFGDATMWTVFVETYICTCSTCHCKLADQACSRGTTGSFPNSVQVRRLWFHAVSLKDIIDSGTPPHMSLSRVWKPALASFR
jgi:hypothetical protein